MIYPVILSGGSGTRLWPLSQPDRPKQFAPLVSRHSMIRETADRFNPADGFAAPIIVGSAAHKNLLIKEAAGFNTPAQKILLEPLARNTAPAIAAAAQFIANTAGPDSLMLVLPADHAIANHNEFQAAIACAKLAAAQNMLVTFGIVPDEPHTGYGYIRQGSAIAAAQGVFGIDAFVEKPDLKTAQTYLASGDYVWNSGMFLFAAGAVLAELAAHHPTINDNVAIALAQGTDHGCALTLQHDAFASCDAISIDYAVMETTKRGAVVPADLGWSDIGAWPTLAKFATPLDNGNTHKPATDAPHSAPLFHNASNCFVSTTSSRPVAVIGADNLVIVDTEDGLLIVDKDHAQHVKHAADYFKGTKK